MDESIERRRWPRWARGVALVLAASATTAAMTTALLSRDDGGPVRPPARPGPTGSSDDPPPPTEAPDREPLVVGDDRRSIYTDDVRECARSPHDVEPGAAPGEDAVDRIAAAVERIRELELRRELDARLVPRAEVGERFARGLERRYSRRDAAIDTRVLAALGLVDDDLDLRALAVDVARGTAAGFYNPRTGRLYTRATAGGLTPLEQVVLAHEIDHALVDQRLRLPRTMAADPMLGDVMLAHQALAEGDATLLMSQYAEATLDPATLDAFLMRFSNPAVATYPGLPYYLQRSTGFPYYEGLLFACAAWRKGGWDALDDMYRRPPASTAEIVFPWRYAQRASGELPPAPPAPGPRWRQLRVGSLGVFDLMVMLENADVLRTGSAVPGSHAEEVAGWNGGALTAWGAGPRTVVHLSLLDAGVTDEGVRLRRLCGVLRRWLSDTFEVPTRPRTGGLHRFDGGFAGLRCRGASVRAALGPERRAVRRVLR